MASKKTGSKVDKIKRALDAAMPQGFSTPMHRDPMAAESALRVVAEEIDKGLKRQADSSSIGGIGFQNSVPFVGRTPLLYVDPMFDPILFLFPKDRIDEINKRLRHYYETDPIVGNAIDLHSLPPGELVFCNSGVKQIQDIEVGDMVIGKSGSFSRVVRRFVHSHDGDMYKLKAMYLPPVEVTDSHPILAIPRAAILVDSHGTPVKTSDNAPRHSNAKWFMAKDIRKGDVVMFPKFKTERAFEPIDIASYIDKKQASFYAWDDAEIVTVKSSRIHNRIPRRLAMSEDFAELLGWYVAEGSCVGSTVNFTLGTHEQHSILRIAKLVKDIFGLDVSVYEKENNSSHVVLFSAPIARMLVDICGRGAMNKKIPDRVLFGSRPVAMSFLSAYLLGDGCLGFASKIMPSGRAASNVVCNTVSLVLSRQLLLLGSKCGILFGTGTARQKLSPNILYWLSAPKRVIWPLLYGKECPPSKRGKALEYFQQDDSYFYVRITHSESYKYKGDVYDVETEEHSFCAPFVIHNSQLPLSDFYLQCEDKAIERYWNDFKDRSGLLDFMQKMLHDYWLLGEGIGLPVWDPHNFEFSHFNQYPPENVDIFRTYVTPTAFFMLKPDPDLQKKVNSAADVDKTMLNMMDPAYVESLKEGKPFLLGSDKRVIYMARQTTKYRHRGVSVLSRCLKDLLYKDKLRLLQLTFVDRHMHPIKIFKLGSEQRGWIPNKKHFQRLQSLLTQACFSEDTEILTKDHGWAYVGDLRAGMEIASMNPATGEMVYKPIEKMNSYDYDGDMVHFESAHMDMLVTPNHRMWTKYCNKSGDQDWRLKYAGEIGTGWMFRSVPESFSGEAPMDGQVEIGDKSYPLTDLVRLVGFYVSEGHGRIRKDVRKTMPDKEYAQVSLYQNHGVVLDDMVATVGRMGIPHTLSPRSFESIIADKEYKCENVQLYLNDQSLNRWLIANCGGVSGEKRIPAMLKNLPPTYLRILLDALILGDGAEEKTPSGPRFKYYTVSRRLAGDVQEMVLKMGLASFVYERKPEKVGKRISYVVNITPNEGRRIHKGRLQYVTKKSQVSRVPYKGKVYCPTVPPHHLVVARRNGRTMITANSNDPDFNILYHFGLNVDYVGTKDKISNLIPEFEWVERQVMAALFVNDEIIHGGIPSAVRDTVNLRTLMHRYLSVREAMERIMIQQIFLPIAQARGFYRKAHVKTAAKIEKYFIKVAGKKEKQPVDVIWQDKAKGLYTIAHSVHAGLDISAYDLPRPVWKKMNLINNLAEQQLMMKMEEDGKLPLEMLFDIMGIDSKLVMKKMYDQESTSFSPLWRQVRDDVARDAKIRLQVLRGDKPDQWTLPAGENLGAPPAAVDKGAKPSAAPKPAAAPAAKPAAPPKPSAKPAPGGGGATPPTAPKGGTPLNVTPQTPVTDVAPVEPVTPVPAEAR